MRTTAIFLGCLLIALGSAQARAQDSTANRLPPALQNVAEAILKSKSKSESELKDELFHALVAEIVRSNQVDVVRALVKRDIDLKRVGVEGNTLVHIAAGSGNSEILNLLIQSGVDLNRVNQSKRSALFEAANGNHLEAVKILLKHKADVNGNSKHNSPLNTAAWYGHTRIVKVLLAAKADLNQTDSDGNTALHKAIWQGQTECARMLLNAGADLQAKNSAGLTPLSLVESSAKNKAAAGFRPWGPEQLIGPPSQTWRAQMTWCPAAINAREHIEATFETYVKATEVVVHTSPTADVVLKIVGFDKNDKTIEIGKNKRFQKKQPTVFTLKIDGDVRINRLKLDLDCGKNPNWIYVDAIGLKDEKGKMHWIDWATTSSSYARGEIPKLIRHRHLLQMVRKYQAKKK